MLIINADDWGRSRAETMRLSDVPGGRITSVSAMVFMADSERAGRVGKRKRIGRGLASLNFAEKFSGERIAATLENYHKKIAGFVMAT